jgi:hypothetical protein
VHCTHVVMWNINVCFQVVSVAFQPNLYMAMLSSGASTGIILVVEEKHSHSMCFVDGRPLQSSMINIEHLNCSIGLVDFPHDDVILTNNSWNHDKQCFVNDLNCEVDTISEMMLESLKACNTDVRILTASKIFVCGSGATVSGSLFIFHNYCTHLICSPKDLLIGFVHELLRSPLMILLFLEYLQQSVN